MALITLVELSPLDDGQRPRLEHVEVRDGELYLAGRTGRRCSDAASPSPTAGITRSSAMIRGLPARPSSGRVSSASRCSTRIPSSRFPHRSSATGSCVSDSTRYCRRPTAPRCHGSRKSDPRTRDSHGDDPPDASPRRRFPTRAVRPAPRWPGLSPVSNSRSQWTGRGESAAVSCRKIT